MRSKRCAALAAIALSVVVAGSATAKAQYLPGEGKKVFGYQDESGTFHATPRNSPDVTSPYTVYSGTITVTFDITTKSSLPSGTKLYCGVTVTGNNSSGEYAYPVYEQEGATAATGDTCTISVPYSWKLNTPIDSALADSFGVTFTVIAVDTSIPTMLNSGTFRIVSGNVGGSTLPASAAASKFTVAVTI